MANLWVKQADLLTLAHRASVLWCVNSCQCHQGLIAAFQVSLVGFGNGWPVYNPSLCEQISAEWSKWWAPHAGRVRAWWGLMAHAIGSKRETEKPHSDLTVEASDVNSALVEVWTGIMTFSALFGNGTHFISLFLTSVGLEVDRGKDKALPNGECK